MQRRFVVAGLVAAVLAVGAVGLAVSASGGSVPSYGGGSGGGYGYGDRPAPPAAAVATVATGSTRLGRVLVDGTGRTLYLFEADPAGASACTGSCASAWPPLTTSGPAQATGGASASLLGTVRRADGTSQVTYAHHPLYAYAGDTAPGDTAGQGLDQFGAPWFVLDGQGARIAAR